MVQESTKESPFLLVYERDPRLPTSTPLEQSPAMYPVDPVEDYQTELLTTLKKAHELAMESICKTQEKQCRYYDGQSTNPTFQVSDRVMILMPSKTIGKNRKLARPYHRPYCVINVIQTNAEVQLIEHPSAVSIFVALGRLCTNSTVIFTA